jgi:hypothetical protein
VPPARRPHHRLPVGSEFDRRYRRCLRTGAFTSFGQVRSDRLALGPRASPGRRAGDVSRRRPLHNGQSALSRWLAGRSV